MDIIAAISTGNAATAIGVVRISGDGCFALCDQLFRPLYGSAFSSQQPRKMIYGDVLDPYQRRNEVSHEFRMFRDGRTGASNYQ